MVSDGALVPMMHFTLGSEDVQKLVKVKQLQTSILVEEICFNSERSFHTLSQDEKEVVGNHMRQLVQRVAGDALVPLMNLTLSQ